MSHNAIFLTTWKAILLLAMVIIEKGLIYMYEEDISKLQGKRVIANFASFNRGIWNKLQEKLSGVTWPLKEQEPRALDIGI